MPDGPRLLNDDGSASIATALLMSHHGLRRDIALFAAALQRGETGVGADAQGLCDEWRRFGATLHGHHVEEDTNIETTGVVCPQIHAGPPSEAWYKDITIVDLGY